MLEVWDGLSQASALLDFGLTGFFRLWNGLVATGIGDEGSKMGSRACATSRGFAAFVTRVKSTSV